MFGANLGELQAFSLVKVRPLDPLSLQGCEVRGRIRTIEGTLAARLGELRVFSPCAQCGCAFLSGTRMLRPPSRYTVSRTQSRQIPAVSEMSQECRATPPKRPCRTCFPTPLSQLSSECSGERRTDVRLEGGGVALEVPEVPRENFFRKRIALHGGVAAVPGGFCLCVFSPP